MPVTPTGHVSLPRQYLAATVAACPSFQAWTATPDAPSALARIFQEEADPAATTPIAVVGWDGRYSRTKIAGGASNWFAGQGQLGLLFRDAIAPGAVISDALNAFENHVGAVIADMESLAGQAGYLDIESIRWDEQPKRPEWQEENAIVAGPFFEVVLLVEFRAL